MQHQLHTMLDSYFDKIYYLNLDKHKDRLKHTKVELSKSKLLSSNAERFVAVDGSMIDLSSIDNTIITDSARSDIKSGKQKTFGISLTYGSLGCALSHRKIFQECKQSKKPFLILEDDFIIDHMFDQDMYDVIHNIDNSFDILYLGFHDIPSAKIETVGEFIAKPIGLTCGTYGYIISPNGASKLLQYVFPLECQIDSMMSRNLSKIKSYCSKKTLVKMSWEFPSNTQHQISCDNIYENTDDWMKLFR